MTAGGFAYACFAACQQSHPFEERRIPLISNDEPVKIGRAVAKLRACPDNAIFDCKVLSRNHAVVWYEDGKFFMKDTKSSNGTFVNNQRLSKGSDESLPKQIYSGDIIQFGVDIVENTRKVTHGCIIAMVRLYFPDGREVLAPPGYTNDANCPPASPTSSSAPPLFTTLTSQELYQLQQYIKEAVHREQMIETKLQALQSLMSSTQEASQSSWQALIDEDRLLSRIDMLENQLALTSKNMGEDKLREQLHELHDERLKYENSAKESLRRALQEKMEAVQRLTDVERSLETTEEECGKLRDDCESAQKELQSLALQHTEALVRIQTLTSQLEEAERRSRELERRFCSEKSELEAKLAEMTLHESILTARIETLQSDNDFGKEQLAAMKVRLDQLQTQGNLRDVANEAETINDDERYRVGSSSADVIVQQHQQQQQALPSQQRNNVDEINSNDSERLTELAKNLKSTQTELETCRQQLRDSCAELAESKQRVDQLTGELSEARLEVLSSGARVANLEDILVANERRYNSIVDEAVGDMLTRCQDAVLQKHRNEELMIFLREQIAQLENRLKGLQPARSRNNSYGGKENGSSSASERYSLQNGDVSHGGDDDLLHNNVSGSEKTNANTIQSQKLIELELANYKEQLRNLETLREKSDETNRTLTKQIDSYDTRLTDACVQVENMRQLLTSEQDRCQRMNDDVRLLKLQLDEAHAKSPQHSSEVEELRSKVTLLTEELELERSLRTHGSLDDENARVALHRQAAKNQAEFASLKEECASLRKRIVAIEAEIKTSRKENARLSTENQRLKHSYDLLLQQKACLENEETSWRFQVDTAKYESDDLRNQLNEAHEELMALRQRKLELDKELSFGVKQNLAVGNEPVVEESKLDELETQTRTVTICSAIPLLLLFISILVAFLPFFSTMTATNDVDGDSSRT